MGKHCNTALRESGVRFAISTPSTSRSGYVSDSLSLWSDSTIDRRAARTAAASVLGIVSGPGIVCREESGVIWQLMAVPLEPSSVSYFGPAHCA